MYRNHRVICDQDYSWGRRRIQAVIHRTPDRPDDGLNVQRLNFLMRVLYTSISTIAVMDPRDALPHAHRAVHSGGRSV